MILIIDGYNVVKQVFPGQKTTMDKQRMIFIRQLGYYKLKKSPAISDIVVVFDAGPLTRATREVREGIVVIFSGQKCSADDWILQYVEKHRTQDLLLVSSDRKLVMACQHYGAKHMPAPEFYGIMQEVLVHDIQAHTGVWGSSQELHKYRSRDYVFDDDEHEIDTKAVDMLMEQASTRVPDKDDDKKQEQPRKGNAQMLSKHEKKIVGTLKKLR